MSESELKQFYSSHVEKVYKLFYYKLLKREKAEDLTSIVFMRFVESIRCENSIDNYTKFLYGIAKNVFLEYLREKYKSPFYEYNELDFEKYADQYSEEIEEKESIEERALPYIEKLPESQKIVAKLRFIEKKELSEICTHLKRDMNYVKTTQKRAIASLRKLVACTP